MLNQLFIHTLGLVCPFTVHKKVQKTLEMAHLTGNPGAIRRVKFAVHVFCSLPNVGCKVQCVQGGRVHIVQCAMCNVSSVYSAECKAQRHMHSVQCPERSMCTVIMCSVQKRQCAMLKVHSRCSGAVCNVQMHSLCTVQHAVCNVQSAQYVLCTVLGQESAEYLGCNPVCRLHSAKSMNCNV